MPATIKPASHKTNALEFEPGYQTKPHSRLHQPSCSAEGLLQEACPTEYQNCKELLRSSISLEFATSTTVGSANGFVYGAIQAWNNHYNLIIRPEDVWFAILTQLSVYINHHSEEMRGKFVPFDGQKELTVDYPYDTRHTVDFGDFAKRISVLLERNVVDKGLREWMMPAFTTTTDNDVVVGSILMMGAMKKYFTYKCRTGCGIPSVRLLGEKADWEKMSARLEKLLTFGEEPAQWYKLLKPILSRFIASFDNPEAEVVLFFWNRIAHYKGGSGSKYFSGWITAFCFWDNKGRCMYRPRTESVDEGYFGSESDLDEGGNVRVKRREPVSAEEAKQLAEKKAWEKNIAPVLQLDGVYYHYVETDEVPMGFSVVPVEIQDKNSGYNCMANMIAGSVGVRCSRSGEVRADGHVGLDTVQAESGWWIFELKK